MCINAVENSMLFSYMQTNNWELTVSKRTKDTAIPKIM